MAGKPLTERQKAERAVQKRLKQDRAELGPLFADQAEPVDTDAYLLERRLGWARSVERVGELLGGMEVLGRVSELGWQNLARRHVPADAFSKLLAHAERVYGDKWTYRCDHWRRVLAGERVVFGYELRFDPARVNAINTDGRYLVDTDVWPPEGWHAPYTLEQLHHHFWKKCQGCGLYHAPGQTECLPDEAESVERVIPKREG